MLLRVASGFWLSGCIWRIEDPRTVASGLRECGRVRKPRDEGWPLSALQNAPEHKDVDVVLKLPVWQEERGFEDYV